MLYINEARPTLNCGDYVVFICMIIWLPERDQTWEITKLIAECAEQTI